MNRQSWYPHRITSSRSKESIPSLAAPYGTFSTRNSEKSLTILSSLSASFEQGQILATFDEFCCYCSYEYCANRSDKFTNLQSIQSIKSANKMEAMTSLPGKSTQDFNNTRSDLHLETTANGSSAEKTIENAMRNRNSALDELILTEKSYVNDLSLIVNGYICDIRTPNIDIPVPDGLKNGKYRMIFANIEAIYEWHREYVSAKQLFIGFIPFVVNFFFGFISLSSFFLVALQESITNSVELEALIERSKSKLIMLYMTYCRNKPISEQIVLEHLDYFDRISAKLKCNLQVSKLKVAL